MTDAVALDRIAAMLRRPEWDADMLDTIADAVRETGRDTAPQLDLFGE